jgi:small-conductance mechanosensitive channel
MTQEEAKYLELIKNINSNQININSFSEEEQEKIYKYNVIIQDKIEWYEETLLDYYQRTFPDDLIQDLHQIAYEIKNNYEVYDEEIDNSNSRIEELENKEKLTDEEQFEYNDHAENLKTCEYEINKLEDYYQEAKEYMTIMRYVNV